MQKNRKFINSASDTKSVCRHEIKPYEITLTICSTMSSAALGRANWAMLAFIDACFSLSDIRNKLFPNYSS